MCCSQATASAVVNDWELVSEKLHTNRVLLSTRLMPLPASAMHHEAGCSSHSSNCCAPYFLIEYEYVLVAVLETFPMMGMVRRTRLFAAKVADKNKSAVVPTGNFDGSIDELKSAKLKKNQSDPEL